MNIVKRRTSIKLVVNSSIERHPVPVLGVDYRVKIVYKNIKITELDVEEKTIKISLPNKYKKMEKTRIMVGFAPEEFEIKDMKVFGKYEDNKIMLNPQIVKYGRKIIDYVVLHQYCHLKYKTHCRAFYDLLKKYEPDYKYYDELLNRLEK